MMERNDDYYVVRLKQGNGEVVWAVYDFNVIQNLIKTVQKNNIEQEEEKTIFITIS